MRVPQLQEAKRKNDEDQGQLEDLAAARKRQDKESEAMRERLAELQSENQRLSRSKKKMQEEVMPHVIHCDYFYSVL